MQIFLDKDRKLCNRKPRNGKPRKTRDYCKVVINGTIATKRNAISHERIENPDGDI